jgi:hypothetical protein
MNPSRGGLRYTPKFDHEAKGDAITTNIMMESKTLLDLALYSNELMDSGNCTKEGG